MDKPNILLVTTDQQRFDTIAALGNQEIYTPHLDWLVDEGITFTRCYSETPICMPARATIMTGIPGYKSGLIGNAQDVLPMKENPTLPEVLTKAGYQTRAQGKMHFHPTRCNYGFEHMELPFEYYTERMRSGGALPKQHGVGENEMHPVISTVNEQESLTHWTVQRSIDFIETRDDTRPFFMWTSFGKPHPPFDPCANYWELYQNQDVSLPRTGDWSERIEDMPQGFLESSYVLNNYWRFSDDQKKQIKRAYYACITQIDYQLGLLFGRLRELDMLKDTWIIFTADHGEMLGDHHIGAKSLFLEGSAHVPMIVRPPSDPWDMHPDAGKRVDHLVTLADVMPTILNAAGVDVPDTVVGQDMLTVNEDRTFFGECSGYYGVVDGDMKYVRTSYHDEELLFNLKDDPYEQHDLSKDPSRADVLKRMQELLIEHLEGSVTGKDMVKDGTFQSKDAPSGPDDFVRWPGFHTIVDHRHDVLH